MVVSGNTASTETTFPVSGGPDLTANGNIDAFVALVDAPSTIQEHSLEVLIAGNGTVTSTRSVSTAGRLFLGL